MMPDDAYKERAGKIWEDSNNMPRNEAIPLIAAEIRQAVEEANVCCWDTKSTCNTHRGKVEKVKRDVYEDAAKIAHPDGVGGDLRYHKLAEMIAYRIRARAAKVAG